LPKQNIEYPIDVDTEQSGVTILMSNSSSNSIVYVDVGFDTSSVKYHDIILLPIFLRMLKETGSDEIYRTIGIHTGGINLQLLFHPAVSHDSQVLQVSSNKYMHTMLFIRGKCLKEKFDVLLALMKKMIEESNLDDMEKFVQIVSEEKSDLTSSIISYGNGYILKRIQARYDTQAFITDKVSGIRYAKTLDELLARARTNWTGIHAQLLQMREDITANYQSNIIFSLTGPAEEINSFKSDIITFCKSFSRIDNKPMVDFRIDAHPWIVEASREMLDSAPLINEGFEVPSQISFVGKGGIAYGTGERVTGSSSVVKQYLDSGYLWETIRAKNGAYGVQSVLNSWDGTFIFISYRDPNLALTLDAYDDAALSILDDVRSGVITEEVIITAIIGAIGNMDAKSFSPNEIGWRSMLFWLSGSSSLYRQTIRQEILGTVESDFISFANRLQKLSQVSLGVVASTSTIQMAISLGRNFTIAQIT
jgi:Zn-dependent M16 (insulinase) family peptidase